MNISFAKEFTSSHWCNAFCWMVWYRESGLSECIAPIPLDISRMQNSRDIVTLRRVHRLQKRGIL